MHHNGFFILSFFFFSLAHCALISVVHVYLCAVGEVVQWKKVKTSILIAHSHFYHWSFRIDHWHVHWTSCFLRPLAIGASNGIQTSEEIPITMQSHFSLNYLFSLTCTRHSAHHSMETMTWIYESQSFSIWRWNHLGNCFIKLTCFSFLKWNHFLKFEPSTPELFDHMTAG